MADNPYAEFQQPKPAPDPYAEFRSPATAPTASQPLPPLSGARISAQPKPSGMFGSAEKWLSDASGDIRDGGQSTVIGKALAALGAKGTNYGESKAVGNFMGSPVLGPMRAAKGLVELPQGKVWQGAKDVAGGTMDAMQIPGAFMGGPVASKAINAADAAVPSLSRAARNFEALDSAIGNSPVEVSGPMQVANTAKRLETMGHTGSTAINKFMKQVEVPVQAAGPGRGPVFGPNNIKPIPFRDAREFASAAGNPAVTDKLATDPRMQSMVKTFARSMDDVNRAAAEQAGMGAEYNSAMKDYRGAKNLRENARTALKWGAGVGLSGTAAGIAKHYLSK